MIISPIGMAGPGAEPALSMVMNPESRSSQAAAGHRAAPAPEGSLLGALMGEGSASSALAYWVELAAINRLQSSVPVTPSVVQ